MGQVPWSKKTHLPERLTIRPTGNSCGPLNAQEMAGSGKGDKVGPILLKRTAVLPVVPLPHNGWGPPHTGLEPVPVSHTATWTSPTLSDQEVQSWLPHQWLRRDTSSSKLPAPLAWKPHSAPGRYYSSFFPFPGNLSPRNRVIEVCLTWKWLLWGGGGINLSLRCHVSFWLPGRDRGRREARGKRGRKGKAWVNARGPAEKLAVHVY